MAHVPPRTAWLILLMLVLLVGSNGAPATSHPSVPGLPGRSPAGPGLETAGSGTPPTTASSAASGVSGLDHARQVENGLRAQGVSPSRVHLPDFGAEVADRDRTISPSYTQAPAPMGVADLGLENESGVIKPYSLNTTSAEGTVDITDLQSLYVDGDGPDTYGIQMNSVVAGVTIFGVSTYQFWSQNYVDYTPSTQQLVFGDEVWNFSSPSGVFPTSSVYSFSPNGTFADFPYLYQGYGPSITVGYPFSLSLYLNTSVIDDRAALFFNYTVESATVHQSASFDYLIFNSTVGTPTAPAPVPYYQADGYQYDPIGLINDIEIDLLGNDGGDVATFYQANATISLQYYDATTHAMEEVPSAFNAGQETGENSVGLAVFPSGTGHPYADVRTGPSFVGGLWNYSGKPTDISVTVHLQPSNAFIFVNSGATLKVDEAQWVPSDPNGTTTFYLPPGGSDTVRFLLSDYSPLTVTLAAVQAAPLAVTLIASATAGIYTPLFAFNNAQLANISVSGAGTKAHPYVLESNQVGPLDAQFATWDDYLFPVFPGLLLANTSAWITVVPPSFAIDLPSWQDPGSYGLPSTNDLQIEIYESTNVSVVRAPSISGWLSSFLEGFPVASLILWNTTGDLVASNTFADQGVSIVTYGGTGNTFWGNSFYDAPVSTGTPSAILNSGSATTGVSEAESGDLVYNNYFSLPVPAATQTVDPVLCGQYGICLPALYQDWWNVSLQPATNVHVVDGMALTGSIIGTSYQGGNYWSNYGTQSDPYGVLPYNDSDQILVGGDYYPLLPFTLYTVTFQATGAAIPSSWNVSAEGVVTGSLTSSLVIESPNGTFSFQVGTPANFEVAAPANFSVAGAAITVSLTFTPIVGVTFSEGGLALGATWSASLTGPGTQGVPVSQTSSTGSIVFTEPAGTYQFTAQAQGYTASPSSGTLSVGAGGSLQAVSFTLVLATLEVQVAPGSAQLTVQGVVAPLTHGVVWQNVTPGVYALVATASGYYPYFNNVTLAGGITTSVGISLDPVTPPVGPDGTFSLTVHPASASVSVGGLAVSLSGGAYSGSYAPGVYTVVASAPGYLPYYNNVSIESSHTSTLSITLTAVPTAPPAPSPSATSISQLAWGIIAGLAALAAVLLVVVLVAMRRGRPPASEEKEEKPKGDPTVPPGLPPETPSTHPSNSSSTAPSPPPPPSA